MKHQFLLPIGMLCLACYFILDRYTETPDFILGLFVGLSIALNLVGIYVMGKWIRENR